jgi:hypothetical protein
MKEISLEIQRSQEEYIDKIAEDIKKLAKNLLVDAVQERDIVNDFWVLDNYQTNFRLASILVEIAAEEHLKSNARGTKGYEKWYKAMRAEIKEKNKTKWSQVSYY